MSLMPFGWDAFPEITNLHRTIDRLFGDWGGQSGAASRGLSSMPMNVTDQGTTYELEAPLAGFSPEEVDVSFNDGVLTIRAEHQQGSEGGEGEAVRREFVRANAVRQVALGNGIDPEKIEAKVEHGLLKVTVPKPAEAQARRIPIAGASANPALGEKSSST